MPPSAQLPLPDNDFSGSPPRRPTSSQRNTPKPAGGTTGPGGYDAVAIAQAAVSECGLSAGFRTPAMTRPATRSDPAKTERAKYPKNRHYWTTTAEPMRQTLVELPFIGNHVVCLGRDQAARSRLATVAWLPGDLCHGNLNIGPPFRGRQLSAPACTQLMKSRLLRCPPF